MFDFDFLIKKDWIKNRWPFQGGYGGRKRRSDSVLAIDISYSAITILEISRGAEGYILENYARELLSSDSLDVWVSTLETLIERLSCSASNESRSGYFCSSPRSVVMGLSGPSVISRWIPLEADGQGQGGLNVTLEALESSFQDPLHDDQFQAEIELIYEQVIPFPLEESYYDYQFEHSIQDSKTATNTADTKDAANTMNTAVRRLSSKKNAHPKAEMPKAVLIAACLRSTVEDWVAVMESLNLKLEMISLSFLGIASALNFILRADIFGERMAALEFLENQIILYFFEGSRLLFSRDFSIEWAGIREGELGGAGIEAADAVVLDLCDQIKMAFNQYWAGQKQGEPKYWILFGDNRGLSGLKEALEKHLNVVLQVVNPFADATQTSKIIKCSDKISLEECRIIQDKGPMMMAALGLALNFFINREARVYERKINLLPWRSALRKEKNKKFYFKLGVSACLAFCLVLGIRISLEHQKTKIENYKRELVAEKNQLNDRMQAIENLKKDQAQLFKHIRTLEMLKKDRLLWLKFFNGLPLLLPEGLFLSSLLGKEGLVILEGNASTHCSVAALLKALSEMKDPCLFKEIQLTEITTDKQEMGLKFKLQFKIEQNESKLEQNKQNEKHEN